MSPAPNTSPSAPSARATAGVRLEGFRTTDPQTVTVVGLRGARLVLLVVPPSTAAPAAEAALDAASSTGDTHSSADLLADGRGAAIPA